jgi:predicted HAD superfamily Cof-like phosphohydrolase
MEFIKAVVEFNQQVLGIEQRSPAPLAAKELDISVKCLSEELEEFCDASREADYIGQVDAIVDLLYFGVGVLYKLGLTPEQIHGCCMAVHAANITKKKGVNAKRDTGAADATKPEGWVPPEERLRKIIFDSSNA